MTSSSPAANRRSGRGPTCDGRRLFDLLRGPHWTVLTESARTAELPALRELADAPPYPTADRPVARRVRLYAGAMDRLPAEIVVVGPDGHGGLLADDPATVRGYLARYAIMCRHQSAG